MIVVFALVAAFGLVTAVAVNILLTTQEAEAVGCANNPGGGGARGVNASAGKCFR